MKQIRVVFTLKGTTASVTRIYTGNIGSSIKDNTLTVFNIDTRKTLLYLGLEDYDDVSIYNYN